jgi:cobalt-zinc-cadmium resistance protein CzcA
MLKSIIAFCLSRRAIVVFALLAFAGAGSSPLRSSTSRPIRTRRRSSWKSRRRRRAFPPRRWSVTTRFPWRSDSTRRPASMSSAPLRSTACPLSGSCSSMGVDYHFAYAQADIALQQNVTLPGNQIPQINRTAGPARSIATGAGPEAFWADQSAHGSGLDRVAPALDHSRHRGNINSWGGTTKEFEVEVDPLKLEAFNVTVPQILTAWATRTSTSAGAKSASASSPSTSAASA